MIQRKYLYHITQQKWDDIKILSPRIYGKNRCDEEPHISRVCVAPTIAGCLIALGSCLNEKRPIYVYRTKYKVSSVKPYEVDDAHITGERWLIKSIKFIKMGTVNTDNLPEELYNLSPGNYDGRTRRKQKTMMKKLVGKKLLTVQ